MRAATTVRCLLHPVTMMGRTLATQAAVAVQKFMTLNMSLPLLVNRQLASILWIGFFFFLFLTSDANADVVVGGTVDAYLDYAKVENVKLLKLDSGGMKASVLTIKSLERLDAETTIAAQLEFSFDIDDGSQPSPPLKVAQLVAIGQWGRISLGKQRTPAFQALVKADAFASSFWGTPYAVFVGGVRYNTATEAIQYQSPRLLDGRFQGTFLYSAADSGGPSSKHQWFLSASTQPSERLEINLVHGVDRRFEVDGPARRLSLLGFAYKFGGWRVSGATQAITAFDGVGQVNEYTVGLSWQAKKNTLLMTNCSSSHDSVRLRRSETCGLAGVYDLSRDTSLYASFAKLWNNNNASRGFTLPVSPGQDSNDLMFGVRKNF